MPARVTRTPLGLIAGGIALSVVIRALWRRLRTIDLRGQVVVITGSSRGLGFALAQEFARKGASLVLCARNQSDLEKTRRALAEQGAPVLAIPCDVRDREQARRLIEQATAHFGRVDVLVNNAGTILTGPILSQTLQDFEETMAIMFWGTVYTTMAVLPQMRERRSGHIVNITSIGGKVSVPHLLSYCSAKFAAVGFSEGLHACPKRAASGRSAGWGEKAKRASRSPSSRDWASTPPSATSATSKLSPGRDPGALFVSCPAAEAR